MSDLSVLGLGQMGSALAATAINAGYKTVVWNRTASRAEPLVTNGAQHVSDVADAIEQSPITIVCVSDYEAADSILRTPAALAALKDRVLVQLSSGSPQLARTTDKWASEAGALYVDGGIMGYPSDIGTPDSIFIVSGNEEGYTRAEPILRILAPKTEYLGADPSHASAIESAILSASVGLVFGVVNGAALCEASGISIVQYAKLVQPVLNMDVEATMESARKIENGNLEETDAYLETWAEALNTTIETIRDAGYSVEIPKFYQNLLNRAIEKGFGAHDIGVLIEVLRPAND